MIEARSEVEGRQYALSVNSCRIHFPHPLVDTARRSTLASADSDFNRFYAFYFWLSPTIYQGFLFIGLGLLN